MSLKFTDESFKNSIRNGAGYVWVQQSSIPGTLVYEFIHPAVPVPMGFVWARELGNGLVQTLHSYIWADVRRCGIRTRIHERMTQDFTRFTTPKASDEIAEKWLLKNGFTKDSFGEWNLRVKE
jgi:hypothetical protein